MNEVNFQNWRINQIERCVKFCAAYNAFIDEAFSREIGIELQQCIIALYDWCSLIPELPEEDLPDDLPPAIFEHANRIEELESTILRIDKHRVDLLAQRFPNDTTVEQMQEFASCLAGYLSAVFNFVESCLNPNNTSVQDENFCWFCLFHFWSGDGDAMLQSMRFFAELVNPYQVLPYLVL